MNYRHLYHAGNFADLFKHLVLDAILVELCAKPGGWVFVDLYAGAGNYELRSPEALRSGEAAQGVDRLLAGSAKNPLLSSFRARLVEWRGGGSRYPGSPTWAQLHTRAQDRQLLCELQPDACAELRINLGRDARVAIHQRDAHEAVRALLPPSSPRGLLLLDPPFEKTDEFERLAADLSLANKRWPTGRLAAWYPIKSRHAVDRWERKLGADLDTETLRLRFSLPRLAGTGLDCCGMLLVRPPWGLAEKVQPALAELARILS